MVRSQENPCQTNAFCKLSLQLALNKLVMFKVENPTVMGLLVEGLKLNGFGV
ncbi:hypothetical protein MUCCIDRAFT_109652 [Mucor lusitanicus CBS 277.49]|uniref:Uncharacterized protein n=1 Tax=Mucor lusitanicus CBS 277.49 TaxID=747725 RepID=A0A168KVA8_MUCCL|nr:hypothetical protein MUCCIDRAFT_109652 [Mucor lusitanicus CBS 277.49]